MPMYWASILRKVNLTQLNSKRTDSCMLVSSVNPVQKDDSLCYCVICRIYGNCYI